MNKIPYSPDEMNVVGEHVSTKAFETMRGPAPKYNTPITLKENFNACLAKEGDAMWIPTSSDFLNIESRVNKDHIARAEVMDLGPLYSEEEKGGPDMFGIEWVFVPQAGGSMVQPGSPALLDANDWPEVIKFPDVEAMDWEGVREMNARMAETERAFKATFQNGLFERLISFMDFEGAALAIIDEDQKDAIHSLFAKLCDLYEAMISKYKEYLNIDGVMFHDDWGSQHAPFFSPQTCNEMLVPYLKRLADFCHSKGLWFEHHSCGKTEILMPCRVAANIDMWVPQPINDMDMLYEKYGDKVIFGIAPKISMDATPEECEAAAKEFAEKYAPQMATKPIIMSGFGAPPNFAPLVYRYSREILAAE
ncbi:MAG: methyltransferase [Eubacteriaceae bacterium]|nr:methyltransferase [Eubacteriaceae bacterium]